MQIPELAPFLDLGWRAGMAVLVTVQYFQVREMKRDLGERVARVEFLLMRAPDITNHHGASAAQVASAPERKQTDG